MSERNDRDERSGDRRGAEGVRIIGSEEAQAALEAGAAAGRRPEDELRFGDVPPAPTGPRPTHRFPLPDSVDPADAVPRPPIVAPPSVDPVIQGRLHHVEPAEAHDPQPWHERPGVEPGGDDTAQLPVGGAGETGRPWTSTPAGGGDVDGPAAHGSAGADETVLDLPATPPDPPGAAEGWAGYEAPAHPDTGGAAEADVFFHPWTPSAPAWPAAGDPLVADPLDGDPPADGVPSADLGAPPGYPSPADPRPEHLPPEHLPHQEGITVSGGYETELPPWTDPPTGEVPRVLAERSAERAERADPHQPGDEDLAAWQALGTRSATWRDDSTGWAELDALGDLDHDDVRVGALDTSRAEHSDLYSFDEDFERLEEERSGQHRALVPDYEEQAQPADSDEQDDADEAPEPRVTRVSTRQARQARPPRGGGLRRRGRADGADADADGEEGGDLGGRLGIGIGLVALLIVAYLVGPLALLVLATAVVTTAAAEVYAILRPSGFRPATLLGLVATVGVMFAAYWRGPGALPLVAVLVFVVAMLWYLLGVVDARPLANVAVTVSAFVWVGVLGSYAALLLRSHHGRGLFLGAVVPAVAADIVAYFAGRQVGSRPMAPAVSPGKTWEGAIGGAVAAVVVGLIIGHAVRPWGGLGHGLVLGVVVAVLAPVGDLFESMVKRDLKVKDSGSVLSGHGGVLDRFDAVLLCLPAAYYLASLWGYVK